MKYFVQQGDCYVMKPQYNLAILVFSGLLGFAYASYLVEFTLLAISILIVAVLTLWSFISKKIYVDIKRKYIYAKIGFIHPTAQIPLDKIVHFEFHILSQNLIRTNAELVLRYSIPGGEKTVLIAQGFTKSTMESILNELQEIIALTKIQ
ncbi:hypothetical protein [Myroides sp. WP-1]|uniref:hypothetical protein n=1 Tax=Myroides sp. WP-1 TaxID=2759944 RepID=UPI0015F8328A|nr:hypothetical protein [Myroides sp. WP-1]MBB1138148.1 hypothetical protein [Myroides sp. WP-1]